MAAPKGNQYGAKAKVWTMAIERALDKRSRVEQRDTLEAIADELITQALSGDKDARREIGDRLEGKPLQTTDVNVTRRNGPKDYTEEELIEIIERGRRERVSESQAGEQEPNSVH